jgi:hypothetical protein
MDDPLPEPDTPSSGQDSALTSDAPPDAPPATSTSSALDAVLADINASDADDGQKWMTRSGVLTG